MLGTSETAGEGSAGIRQDEPAVRLPVANPAKFEVGVTGMPVTPYITQCRFIEPMSAHAADLPGEGVQPLKGGFLLLQDGEVGGGL